VPYLRAAKELKSKPTQHSVKELRSIGIQPDIVLCRSEKDLPAELRAKVALFCSVPKDAVKVAIDVDNIYKVPLSLAGQKLDSQICKLLRLAPNKSDLSRWKELASIIDSDRRDVHIGVVGKYVDYPDSYKSLGEALTHAGFFHRSNVHIHWVESSRFEKGQHLEELAAFDGLLIPGGFGPRGTGGMIESIQYARTHGIPFFGICLGMQLACLEFARNVMGLDGADSSEFDENPTHKIIYKLRELVDIDELGGTMRLGAFDCEIAPDSLAAAAYGQPLISERHRHRFEFNIAYKQKMAAAGLRFTGTSPDGVFVEIIEIQDHPWFLGCQFHPEFKSKPFQPHPLFRDFVGAALENRKRKTVAPAENLEEELVT